MGGRRDEHHRRRRWVSDAQYWASNNPRFPLNDPYNHVVYEAHLYFDTNSSGNYNQSYVAQKAHPTIGVDRVMRFIQWLASHRLGGYVGEYGVPTTMLAGLRCSITSSIPSRTTPFSAPIGPEDLRGTGARAPSLSTLRRQRCAADGNAGKVPERRHDPARRHRPASTLEAPSATPTARVRFGAPTPTLLAGRR